MRNGAILVGFRSLFEQCRTGGAAEQFDHDMQNALTFLHSQRMHKVRLTTHHISTPPQAIYFQELLERYNPLHDLTAEERIKATARRVGLDMPINSDRENKN